MIDCWIDIIRRSEVRKFSIGTNDHQTSDDHHSLTDDLRSNESKVLE